MKFEIRYDPINKRVFANKITLVACTLLILIASALLLIFLSIYKHNKQSYLKTPQSENKPLTLGLPKVQTIDPNSQTSDAISEIKKAHDNKFNIVFFYDGYKNQEDALLDIEVLKASLDVIEPFKSLKDHIAFKIFTTEGQKCRVENQPKKYLICDPKLIESFAKLGIDHYKIVLVSPLDFTAASEVAYGANTWLAIPTYQGRLSRQDFQRWLGIIFTQELGHSLGLRYEYFKDKPSSFVKDTAPDGSTPLGHKPGKPNCAPDEQTAKDWWGNYVSVFDNVAYFHGCAAGDNYIYPEQETLMSNLPAKESYGRVSEDYLRGVISCFYASRQSIVFPAGQEATYSAKLSTCQDFKADFPNFWEE